LKDERLSCFKNQSTNPVMHSGVSRPLTGIPRCTVLACPPQQDPAQMYCSYPRPYVALIYVNIKTRAKSAAVNSFPFWSFFPIALPHLGNAEKGSQGEYLPIQLSKAIERK